MASVEGVTYQIFNTFQQVGITPDVCQFDRLQRGRYWYLGIWWTPYIPLFIHWQKQWLNIKTFNLVVSYYVIEGEVSGMRGYMDWMKWQTVCVPSHFSKRMMELMGVRVNHVIPHQILEELPIDHNYGRGWRNRFPTDKKIILYNGSQIGRKALPKLRQAIDILSRKRSDFVMVFHTDKVNQPFHTPIKDLSGVNTIIETDFPHIPIAQAYAKMKYADIIVHPAICEGFGLTVLEALNLGKPLVCINANGVNEIATPKNSWMVTDVKQSLANWSDYIKFHISDYDQRYLAEKIDQCLDASPEEIEEKRIEGLNTAKRYYHTYNQFTKFIL